MSALTPTPRICPFLWFDGNAEAAADFYIGIFPNSRRLDALRNPGEAPAPKGGAMTMEYELDGQRFVALNGGPQYHFTEAISFVVNCTSQQEIDYYWERLTADGGQEIQCGWLKDKFGLCWQVVPANIGALLRHPAAMRAMMGMKKMEIAVLEHAAEGD